MATKKSNTTTKKTSSEKAKETVKKTTTSKKQTTGSKNVSAKKETVSKVVETKPKDQVIAKQEVEMAEDFVEPKKEKEGKSIFSRVMNLILWIVLFIWIAIVLVDFYNVHEEKEPQFCLWNKQTTEYEDGTVTSCMGLGYKIFNYDRESFKAVEFGPFWSSDRTAK